MGKIYLTSDCHFNHNNILRYETKTRPFETIEEMNETIINNWNKTVSNEDTVYVLGDFFMGVLDGIDEILPRLNGHVILIRGNHDTKNRIKKFQEYGIEVKDIDYLEYKGRFFILLHFPVESQEFYKMIIENNSETVLLYGHIHSNAPKGYVNGSFHVGVDTNDLTPVSLEDIWQQSWDADHIQYKEAAANVS